MVDSFLVTKTDRSVLIEQKSEKGSLKKKRSVLFPAKTTLPCVIQSFSQNTYELPEAEVMHYKVTQDIHHSNVADACCQEVVKIHLAKWMTKRSWKLSVIL